MTAAARIYIADMAHQAVLIREIAQPEEAMNESITNEIAKEFESEPLNGPNSIAITRNSERIYFSDSGPWGETSIQEATVAFY